MPMPTDPDAYEKAHEQLNELENILATPISLKATKTYAAHILSPSPDMTTSLLRWKRSKSIFVLAM